MISFSRPSKSKQLRDKAHATAIKTKNVDDWKLYQTLRNQHNKLNRSKETEYFTSKTTKDFKTSKAFWDFYSSSIKIRSDKSEEGSISAMKFNGQTVTESTKIADGFNVFFTSLPVNSKYSKYDCSNFVFNYFKFLKKINKLNIKQFAFRPFVVTEVLDELPLK